MISILLFWFSSSCFAAIWAITYPRPLTDTDERSKYQIKLLALALDQTGVKYKLIPTKMVLSQDKSLKQLGENRNVNVVWSMTDKDRESRLLPIRIPIFKGLIGWRIFLVKQNRLNDFKSIETLQDLQKYKPIQGYDWPDTKILQSNGFDVNTSKSYPGLFTMLAQRQGDFFPRSLVEIWDEYDEPHLDKSIRVEPTLGIRYRTAMYYFVNKNNKTLARLLQVGLETAIENGEFDELFKKEFKTSLERANMDDRFFFEIENPLLPPATPVDRKELWY
jgi:hypothetical protein